ncbi:MAG: anti-sigma factor domain-containing protein [Parvularculaceae bacterium]
MTETLNDSETPPPDDWILAAEVALGLADGEERAALLARVKADRDFARLVDALDQRFATLCDRLPTAEPSPALKRRIDQALFGANKRTKPSASLWQSLAFWRLASVALAALCVALAFFAIRLPSVDPAAGRLIAALAPTNAGLLAFATVDPGRGRLEISDLIVDPGEGDAELWLIPEGGAPVSLGLLSKDAPTRVSLTEAVVGLMLEGAALAVSLEPKGGSATGAPTGPVVALGALRRP